MTVAVYTHVDRKSLTDFLSGYDLGQLKEFQAIAEGVENSNYLLRTTQDQYILTLFEQRVRAQDVPYFLELKGHLHHKGFPCPLPIANRAGAVLGTLCGRPATLVSFLSGKSITNPTISHCRQVGQILGQLHQAAADFSGTRVNGLDLPQWRPLFERSGNRTDEVEPGLSAIIGRELDFLESHWPTGLPVGVIHADLFRDNVFFQQDQLSGVIDFYFACNDQLAYDLAITINAWCFVPRAGQFQMSPERLRNLISGYLSQRRLTPKEQAALSTLCRGAALRFLLTRLYDWLNVPENAITIPHDPREYLAKLEFHQHQDVYEMLNQRG